MGLEDSDETIVMEVKNFFDTAPPLKHRSVVSDKLKEFIEKNSHVGGNGESFVLRLVVQLFLLNKDVFVTLITLVLATEGLHLQSTFSRLDMQSSLSIGEEPVNLSVDLFLTILCLSVLNLLKAPVFKQSHAEKVSKAIMDHHAAVGAGLLFKIPFTTIYEYLQLLQMIAIALRDLGSRAMFYLAAAVSDLYVPGRA